MQISQVPDPIFAIHLILAATTVLAQDISSDAGRYFERANNTNSPTEKIRLLKLALKDSAGFLSARLELAKTHIRMEQYRAAIVQLDSALNDDFRNAYVWYQKGHAHAKLKEYSDALKSINRAIKLIDNVPEFYVNLGQVHYEMKSYHNALKAFERVLTFAIADQDSDRQADAWYWKGRIHFADGDTLIAMNAFKRALELKAGHWEAKARLTEIERWVGRR